MAGWPAMLGLAALFASGMARPSSVPTLFTTHFFDWYRVTPQQPYEAMQRVFTFRPDWEGVGLRPDEVGVSVRYYTVQFRMIQRAGFDGIHYEWFGQQSSDECLRALRETGLRVAMFYDQEIRFSGRPRFIQPTDAFLEEVLRDVGSFYDRIPRDLWLREADGKVPLIFYGYQFDQSVRDIGAWHSFYSRLLDGLARRLGTPVRIYWTDAGVLCQVYAFQHFPDIVSFSFGWWGGQRQMGRPSVTFVAHYDDLGAQVGGRAQRTFTYDHRFLEEHLQLARLTAPPFVFHYGWNEYYEGENIFPDRTWGTGRLSLLSGIVRTLRATMGDRLPPAVLLLDDLYAGDMEKTGSRNGEFALTGAFRYLFPQALARLGVDLSDLPGGKPIVISLNRRRTEQEERELLRLADEGRARVVFFEPDPEHAGPLAGRFAAGPATRPLALQPPPPNNQWVGAEIPIEVDAQRYPFVRVRVRNSPNTAYHVRVEAVDADGGVHRPHDNNSPLDWRQTMGEWESRHENMKAIAEAYAGKPIRTFTRFIVILNAFTTAGDFTAEFADAEFCDAEGNVGLRVPLGDPARLQCMSSFANTAVEAYPRGGLEPGGPESGRLVIRLKARFASDLPVDEASRVFAFAPGVEALGWSSWPPRGSTEETASVRVPLVLRKGNLFWVNTLSTHPDVYRPLMEALGMPPVRVAEHLLFQQAKGRTSVQTPRTTVVLGRDPLPVSPVRLYHPKDAGTPAIYPWPATDAPMAAVRLRNGKRSSEQVSVAFGGNAARSEGTVTLLPGDIVDVYRAPVRVRPTGVVRVKTERTAAGDFVLQITGRGRAELQGTAPGVRLESAGRPVRGALQLPCRVVVHLPD